MKRIIIFSFIAVSALLFASCEQESQPIYPNGDLPIFNGYMQFSTEVSTRANLATDMKGKAFGVIGFEYSNTAFWSGAKSTTTPNAFYNQRVDCDANNGTCQYDYTTPTQSGNKPLPWGDYRYAFFAYHPFNGAGISLSDETATNTPMLTYTYGWLNPTGNPGWLDRQYDVDGDTDFETVIDLTHAEVPVFDLMTAEAVDVTGQTGQGRVALDFKHRMCAIEVLANNYNENIYEYETDADGNFILDEDGNKTYKLDADDNKIIAKGGSARQEISNLTLTIEGLAHTSMTIPLSTKEDDPAFNPVYTLGSVGTRYFKVSSKKVVIPAFNEVTADGRGEGVATSLSQLGSTTGGYLMFIPQAGSTTGIKGTLRWDQLDTFKDNAEDESKVNNEFRSTIDFVPGKLYQVYINFVGDGITIALIEAGNWDIRNVKHTFE